MAIVSFIIPSRVEIYKVNDRESVLQRMVRDIYEKCHGDFEVIVIFDGEPYQKFPEYPNLTVIEQVQSGTKVAINLGARVATGKYLFKLDSHCMVSEGIDEIIQENMEYNWVVMPRFYVLDAENWKWQDERYYD